LGLYLARHVWSARAGRCGSTRRRTVGTRVTLTMPEA